MIKNLIAPIQEWLLSQGKCVGCGKSLDPKKIQKKKGKSLVTCICGRIYVFNTKEKKFRRAQLNEV